MNIQTRDTGKQSLGIADEQSDSFPSCLCISSVDVRDRTLESVKFNTDSVGLVFDGPFPYFYNTTDEQLQSRDYIKLKNSGTSVILPEVLPIPDTVLS